jgi:hypothetical protein
LILEAGLVNRTMRKYWRKEAGEAVEATEDTEYSILDNRGRKKPLRQEVTLEAGEAGGE